MRNPGRCRGMPSTRSYGRHPDLATHSLSAIGLRLDREDRCSDRLVHVGGVMMMEDHGIRKGKPLGAVLVWHRAAG